MAKTIIQSVDRALDVLSAIAGEGDGITLQRLGARLALPQGTVHNIVSTLANRGWVTVRGKPVRYVLGPAVQSLLATNSSMRLRTRAEAAVRQAAQEFPHATVTLALPLGNELVVVLRAPSGSGEMQYPVQRFFSPYTSASGVAFFAFGPDDSVADYERMHPFDEYGAATWTSRQRLDDVVKQSRRNGYSLMTHNGFRLAMPIFDKGNYLYGIFGVSIDPNSAAGMDGDAVITRCRQITSWPSTEMGHDMLKGQTDAVNGPDGEGPRA
jgi:IclR family acetate operon transcriptional repressor